jgi:hypothetical protein
MQASQTSVVAAVRIPWGGRGVQTVAGKPPDPEDAYGHGRIELLAGLSVGVILAAGGVGICSRSLHKHHGAISSLGSLFQMAAPGGNRDPQAVQAPNARGDGAHTRPSCSCRMVLRGGRLAERALCAACAGAATVGVRWRYDRRRPLICEPRHVIVTLGAIESRPHE